MSAAAVVGSRLSGTQNGSSIVGRRLLAKTQERLKALGVDQLIKTEANPCENCHTLNKNIYRCAGCRKVWYCSVECQIKHRPTHKEGCFQPTLRK